MSSCIAALKRFCDLPLFTRFLWGFSATFLVCLLWPASLYLACRSCAKGDEYFRQLLNNEQTYTTAHHLFFAPAIGFFLASLSGAVLDSLTRRSILVLFLLTGLASLLAYQDVFFGPAGSYQLKGACSFLDEEYALRARAEKKPDATFEADNDAFQSSKTTTGVLDTFKRLNFNGFVSGALTWLFLVFCATFIWYSWCTAIAPTIVIQQHLQLVVVALLLIPWIPLRVYTDWYQNQWQTKNWTDAPVVFGLIIALLMVVFFAVTALLAYVRKDQQTTAVSIVGGIGAFVSFFFAVLPKWVPTAHAMLDRLWPSMVLCIGIVGGLLILALAWIFLGNRATDEQGGAPERR